MALRVQEQHSQPIFTAEWGADEELLLISGLILNGLGNWMEVAGHIGTRTKEECQAHYEEVYLGVGREMRDGEREFMPVRLIRGPPLGLMSSLWTRLSMSILTNSKCERKLG